MTITTGHCHRNEQSENLLMKSGFHDDISVSWLADGKRLSMRHGPIDLVLEAETDADGDPIHIKKAYQQAAQAFKCVLTDLVTELDTLRKPLTTPAAQFSGEVASNMQRATASVAGHLFATPMIAVAGAVAEHILEAMTSGNQLKRAYVNNGGDIALHLTKDAIFDIGICADIKTGSLASKTRIHADDNIGGIATSGWQGRSHSLGIADAVTVLAQSAATADAAATLIANSINLPDHPRIKRVAANELSLDSDLGQRLVTVDVGALSFDDKERALERGKTLAHAMFERGDICAAHASLQGNSFSIGAHATHDQLPRSYSQPTAVGYQTDNIKTIIEDMSCA